ncbi:hypothetical protein [Gordonia oryzae]|nr:hypothetical protein [Gordonia oryzae]
MIGPSVIGPSRIGYSHTGRRCTSAAPEASGAALAEYVVGGQ